MHDIGNVEKYSPGGKRVRGGGYWGITSQDALDIAAWIDFAEHVGFSKVALVGHSAGWASAGRYRAETGDRRVAGLVLASGMIGPAQKNDPELIAQAKKLVADGAGEELLRLHASPDATFAALLEEIGPQNQGPDGSLMPMKIEPWPGGRWYRDLGNDNGHFWGHVQAIKRLELLEIAGPLFMSYPVVSNVQYRFSEVDGGTLITFQHAAFGLIQEDHRNNVKEGWGRIHERVRLRAEGTGSRPS
jgi:pimeloyl-ACP methyl ester carboxylesterase